ncbi:hypothetical protein [Sphingobacterium sp. SYP-B4668]|uniref:hypothetical protein n=1 Tax=Sphingobacterium sp. SYP-B4668 TaxID=2996035 RepID=UPI0022DDED7D|nr:hypothetical protein [Sphingobacterium sp. SYP-B4668]
MKDTLIVNGVSIEREAIRTTLYVKGKDMAVQYVINCSKCNVDEALLIVDEMEDSYIGDEPLIQPSSFVSYNDEVLGKKKPNYVLIGCVVLLLVLLIIYCYYNL